MRVWWGRKQIIENRKSQLYVFQISDFVLIKKNSYKDVNNGPRTVLYLDSMLGGGGKRMSGGSFEGG